MEVISPSQVARALRGDTEDSELRLDVERFLRFLSADDMRLLLLYATGLSPQDAGRRLGVPNGQRAYDRAIRRLANLISGNVVRELDEGGEGG